MLFPGQRMGRIRNDNRGAEPGARRANLNRKPRGRRVVWQRSVQLSAVGRMSLTKKSPPKAHGVVVSPPVYNYPYQPPKDFAAAANREVEASSDEVRGPVDDAVIQRESNATEALRLRDRKQGGRRVGAPNERNARVSGTTVWTTKRVHDYPRRGEAWRAAVTASSGWGPIQSGTGWSGRVSNQLDRLAKLCDDDPQISQLDVGGTEQARVQIRRQSGAQLRGSPQPESLLEGSGVVRMEGLQAGPQRKPQTVKSVLEALHFLDRHGART